MKTNILFKVAIIAVLAFLANSAFSQYISSINDIIKITPSQYIDYMSDEWGINIGENKPIILNYTLDIEENYDYIKIYAINYLGEEEFIKLCTGSETGSVSTQLPTGKAVIYFYTDGSVSGDSHYQGFEITLSYDDSYPYTENQFVNNDLYVNGRTYLNGGTYSKENVGVGINSHYYTDATLALSNHNNQNQFNLYSDIRNNDNNDIFGIYSMAYNDYTNKAAYGLYSYAYSSSGNVYGLYSSVSGTAGKKWAGYFTGGDVEISSGNLTLNNAGYKVSQTMDNTGYKINVSNNTRNYKVALAGVDKFKILPGENYSMGELSLVSRTSGTHNIGLGYTSLQYNNSGSFNVALGQKTLHLNSTGSNNVALGLKALRSNTQGHYGIALGYEALFTNSTGSYNIALGAGALRTNTIGADNIALGRYSLYHSTGSSSYNIAIGAQSGRYIANGSTANSTVSNSIFLGANTRAQANSQSNQIVIGHNAIGAGSNTVTLGNDAITKTILRGNVGIGVSNPTYKLEVDGIILAEEVKITVDAGADFVFAPDYNLKSLSEVESFIKENNHLPEIPSEKEMQEEGLSVNEFQIKLLQKIEELTLHAIEQNKTITEQSKAIQELKERIKELEK